MAEKSKQAIQLPYDLWEQTQGLSDAEFRRLFTALKIYDVTGVEPRREDDPIVWAFFQGNKKKQDTLKQNYENTCKRNQEIAEKREAKKRAAKEEPQPDDEHEKAPEAPQAPDSTDNDIDNDIDNDLDNTLVQTGQGGVFSPEELILKCWEKFYDSYPRHEGKKDGKTAYFKIFKSLKGNNQIIKQAQTILAGLNSACVYWENKKTEKRYIPLPATWLSGERWNDDLKGTGPPQHFGQGGSYKTTNSDFYEGLARAVEGGEQ